MFNQFQLPNYVQNAVQELGFHEPTEIQKKVIPLALKGESIVGQSQTGTGKTHAFLLPIFARLNPNENHVQAVITVPTRELVHQIHTHAKHLASHYEGESPIVIRTVVGGTDRQREIEKLKGGAHLIIGTPGRLKDTVANNYISVFKANMFVADEADTLLDMGFLEDIDAICSRMSSKLQMMIFSATIPEKLKPFLKKYMEQPTIVEIDRSQATARKLEHHLVSIKSRSRIDTLGLVLEAYQPYLALIFTNTKKNADEIAGGLTEKGFSVGVIHGDLSPRERKRMMRSIDEHQYQYIVATDIAARGIDIVGVSHVFNVELPEDLDFYVHRVGRTARANWDGIAVTLFDNEDEAKLQQLEKRKIEFLYRDVVRGEVVASASRTARKDRKRKQTATAQEAAKLVKKPTKVKPGYKKKLQSERDAVKRKMEGKRPRR
ncbi:MAG: DEAD/DEAH box helicase [Bacilli bacterium]